jgi:hypothetical protein
MTLEDGATGCHGECQLRSHFLLQPRRYHVMDSRRSVISTSCFDEDEIQSIGPPSAARFPIELDQHKKTLLVPLTYTIEGRTFQIQVEETLFHSPLFFSSVRLCLVVQKRRLFA